jgi:hypothetical protein
MVISNYFFFYNIAINECKNSENFFLTLINDDNNIVFPVLSTGYERGKAL